MPCAPPFPALFVRARPHVAGPATAECPRGAIPGPPHSPVFRAGAPRALSIPSWDPQCRPSVPLVPAGTPKCLPVLPVPSQDPQMSPWFHAGALCDPRGPLSPLLALPGPLSVPSWHPSVPFCYPSAPPALSSAALCPPSTPQSPLVSPQCPRPGAQFKEQEAHPGQFYWMPGARGGRVCSVREQRGGSGSPRGKRLQLPPTSGAGVGRKRRAPRRGTAGSGSLGDGSGDEVLPEVLEQVGGEQHPVGLAVPRRARDRDPSAQRRALRLLLLGLRGQRRAQSVPGTPPALLGVPKGSPGMGGGGC